LLVLLAKKYEGAASTRAGAHLQPGAPEFFLQRLRIPLAQLLFLLTVSRDLRRVGIRV